MEKEFLKKTGTLKEKEKENDYISKKDLENSMKRFGRKYTLSYKLLPSPITQCLNSESVLKYRMDYQRFRLGYPHGTRKEIDELKIEKEEENDMQVNGNFQKSVTAIIKLKNMDPWEDTFSNKINKLLDDISKYRTAYSSTRQGSSKIIEKDLTNLAEKLTNKHMNLLPVSQFIELIKYKTERFDKESQPNKKEFFKPSKLHVHFGVGRLGLGLIAVSLFESNLPFVLVDTSVNMWLELIQSNSPTMQINVNGSTLTTLNVIRPDENIQDDIKGNYFVCTENVNVLRSLVMQGTSFSTSVGGGIENIKDLFIHRGICEVDSLRPTLYGCENDHKAVERLAKSLKGYVDVVSVLVDRICTDRTLFKDKVCVTTEPYIGSIIVLTPSKPLSYSPSFGGKNVIIPENTAEAQYLCNRKISVVNGMHTTLAFMTLCVNNPKNASSFIQRNESYELLTMKTLPEERRHEVRCWMVARILMVLFQHDLNIIKNAHKVVTDEEVADLLLRYAEDTLQRFSTINDTTSRVLSGGVANRYESRLKVVYKFFTERRISSILLSNIILKKSSTTESQIITAVRKLCDESRRFITDTPTTYNG